MIRDFKFYEIYFILIFHSTFIEYLVCIKNKNISKIEKKVVVFFRYIIQVR